MPLSTILEYEKHVTSGRNLLRQVSSQSLGAPVRLPVRYRKECATLLVLVTVATEFIGIGIGLPIMVQFAASLGVQENNVGLVFSVGAFAALLSNFWLPAVSDHAGRKPVLILSLFGCSISYGFQALSRSFEMLLMVIFLGGIFGGTQPVAVAYMSDIFSPAQRPRLIGMVPACASACYIIGPALGGVLSKMSGSFRVPLAAASILVAVMIPVVQVFLPDPKVLISEGEKIFLVKQQDEEQHKMRQSLPSTSSSGHRKWAGETTALRSNSEELSPAYSPFLDWRCHICFCIQFFNIAAFSAFTTCVPLILAEPSFGLSGDQDAVFHTGLVIGSGAAFKSIGLIIMFDRVQKRIGLPRTVSLGAALSFFGFVILALQSSVWGMAIGFAIFSLGVSLLQPGIFSYVTVIAPQEYTARAIGVPNAAINLGEVIGPIASTNLLVAFGYSILFQIFCAILFVQLLVSLCFHSTMIPDEKTLGAEDELSQSRPYSEDEFEDLLSGFFVKLLKERNYNLADKNIQKAVLEMAVRSVSAIAS
uniref:Major facilitator superfamily (MFS) profile domain-containing protein n=2 Tax=Odontella aurita TaxID=265563 RepID=A0A7S4JS27_9STRA|mmetsp:Transcript_52840/g.158189  ORF Transcript_52840/g.158189 Transcript_52840/m.158189 type:complete len:534 (+) Transcript_52840:283-1884(+)